MHAHAVFVTFRLLCSRTVCRSLTRLEAEQPYDQQNQEVHREIFYSSRQLPSANRVEEIFSSMRPRPRGLRNFIYCNLQQKVRPLTFINDYRFFAIDTLAF